MVSVQSVQAAAARRGDSRSEEGEKSVAENCVLFTRKLENFIFYENDGNIALQLPLTKLKTSYCNLGPNLKMVQKNLPKTNHSKLH